MIKKRYITLGIIGILLYGLFMYEPEINKSDAQKYMAIEVTNEKVNLQISETVNINVDQGDEHQTSSINIGDAIKIQNEGDKANVNILGVGTDMGKVERDDEKKEDSGIKKSEVSLKSDNPMVFRAGNTNEKENQVLIDGIGIGELYELRGQNLEVNGIKNVIKIKGNCGHVSVNGIASIVRVEGASSVTVNGIGNRVYVNDKLVSDSVSKSGILNFVFHE